MRHKETFTLQTIYNNTIITQYNNHNNNNNNKIRYSQSGNYILHSLSLTWTVVLSYGVIVPLHILKFFKGFKTG